MSMSLKYDPASEPLLLAARGGGGLPRGASAESGALRIGGLWMAPASLTFRSSATFGLGIRVWERHPRSRVVWGSEKASRKSLVCNVWFGAQCPTPNALGGERSSSAWRAVEASVTSDAGQRHNGAWFRVQGGALFLDSTKAGTLDEHNCRVLGGLRVQGRTGVGRLWRGPASLTCRSSAKRRLVWGSESHGC